MKKFFINLSILLLIAVICLPQAGVSALGSPEVEEDTSEDSNVFFYRTLDRSAYQLSEEQLHASTEELLDAVLEYPYLVDLLTSNGFSDTAYRALCETFNGLAELERRTDAASVMLSWYAAQVYTDEEDSSLPAFYLHTLLSVPAYANCLTEAERNTYAQISAMDLNISPVDTNQASADAATNSGIHSSPSIAFSVNGFDYVRSSIDDTTTGGTTVPLYTALSDYSQSAKQSIAEETARQFGIEILGNATSMYNCHSYAWYHSAPSNESWIEDISPYIDDAHCTVCESPCIGAVAVYFDRYNQKLHSAVVTEMNGDEIICKSKWGANGLFEHNLKNVPAGYWYNSTSIKCKFYAYVHYHSCSVIINNSTTHTRVCNLCDWSITEAYVRNNLTGRCVTCGYSGSIPIPFQTITGNHEKACSPVSW